MASVDTDVTNEGSILVVGEALIDLIVAADGAVEIVAGGAPYNVARTIARLGAPVAFAGAISTDGFGEGLLDGLRGDGVVVDDVQRVEAPTTLAVARLGADGDVGYGFYLEGTSVSAFDPTDIGSIGARFLITGGLALMSDDLVEAVTAGAGAGAVLVVDVNCRPQAIAHSEWPHHVERVMRVLRSATIVKVSDEDIDALWPGVPLEAAIDRIAGLGPQVIVITAGGEAVRVRAGATTIEVDVPELGDRFVDPVGAGDAFIGAFVARWSSTADSGTGRDVDGSDLADIRRAVEYAVEVAALTCTRRGADPPRRADLGRWP